MTDHTGARRVRIPADVDRDDQLLAGLTARQLTILAVPAVVLWGLFLAVRGWVPPAVFIVVALPAAGTAVVLAVGRRDGVTADRLALAALRHLVSARRLVPAPEGIPPLPDILPASGRRRPRPAPLALPARDVSGDGVVDLGRDGAAVLLACSSPSLRLRTAPEQDAAVAAFGRWCNAITGPVQIVVRAEPADLTGLVAALTDAAAGLPHPALEAAAREHAAYLSSLAASRRVVRRQVLLVLRDPHPVEAAGPALTRRATHAVAGLAAAGVTARRLDTAEASRLLAHAVGAPTVAGAPDASGIITRARGGQKR